MESILARIGTGLKEIFTDIEESSIALERQLGEIPDWDSMGAVNFQSFLEQEFMVSIPLDLLGEETTIQDVVGFIENPKSAQVA